MKDLYIFGTLGPACHEVETIMALFRAGATGMRLNLSHGNLAQHADWIANFHIAAKRCGVSPQLLIDMQGPELRTSASLSPLRLETDHIVMTNTLGFPDCVQPYLKTGVHILVDDGRILLETIDHEKSKVLRGGLLLPRQRDRHILDGDTFPGKKQAAPENFGFLMIYGFKQDPAIVHEDLDTSF